MLQGEPDGRGNRLGGVEGGARRGPGTPSSLLLSSLELRDTTIYKPETRAFLETAPYFCLAVVLKSRTVPLGTALILRILRASRGNRLGGVEEGARRGPGKPSSSLFSSLDASDTTIYEP